MLASAGIMATRINDALTTLSVYESPYTLTKTDTNMWKSNDEEASVQFSENGTMAAWLDLKVVLGKFFKTRFDQTILFFIICLLFIHGIYLLIVVYQFGFSKPFDKNYFFTHGIVVWLCFCYMVGLRFDDKAHVYGTIMFLFLYFAWIWHDASSRYQTGEKYKDLWIGIDLISIIVLAISLSDSTKSLSDLLSGFLPDRANNILNERIHSFLLKNFYSKDATVLLALIAWSFIKIKEKYRYWKNYPSSYEAYLQETRTVNDSSDPHKSLPFRLSGEIKEDIQQSILQKLTGVNRPLKILDFGCGNGRRTKELVDALELTQEGARVEIHFYEKAKTGWYNNWKKFVEKEWMPNLKENIQPQNIWKLRRSKKWYEMGDLKLEWLPSRPRDLAEYDIVYASNVM